MIGNTQKSTKERGPLGLPGPRRRGGAVGQVRPRYIKDNKHKETTIP